MMLVIWDEELGGRPVLLHLDKVDGAWTLCLYPHGEPGNRILTRAQVLVNAVDGVQGDLRFIVHRMREQANRAPAGPSQAREDTTDAG